MPPAASGRRAPAGPGAELPPLQKSGLRGPFSLSAPESGALGTRAYGCYGRSGVPAVDHRCTWRVPLVYLAVAFPLVRAAARRWSANRFTFTRGAGLGAEASGCCAWSRSGSLPGTPALAGPLVRGGAGRQAVPCACVGALPGGRAGARVTARQAPGRRGSLRGRARRPRPAGSRPARSAGSGAHCWRVRPSAAFAGRGQGTVRRTGRPFTRVRGPAAIPVRQLIRTPIRTPVKGGVPWWRWMRRTWRG